MTEAEDDKYIIGKIWKN